MNRLNIRILCNLVLINIAINLPETAITYNDMLIKKLDSIEHKGYRKFLFGKALAFYFFIHDSPFHNYNLHFADKIFESDFQSSNLVSITSLINEIRRLQTIVHPL